MRREIIIRDSNSPVFIGIAYSETALSQAFLKQRSAGPREDW